jgi:hypothetical protein
MPRGNEPFQVFHRPPVILEPAPFIPPVIHEPGPFIAHLARIEIIKQHWNALGGAPGQQVSELENFGAGYRIRYQQGAIYYRGNGTPAWVYGDIGAKYDSLGGPNSWLGFPTADEAPFPEGGRVSTFERGDIYWWPDVGAVELNEVVVHYTGLICFGETDWDQASDSDEPYVVLGTVSPFGPTSTRSQVYSDVDGGESRLDLIEIYRGKPYGLAISAMLMEHDEADPDKYKAAMGASVGAAAAGITAAVGLIPGPGPFIAMAVGPALSAVAPAVTEELNRALDMGDDKLGAFTTTLNPKQMVVLATRTQNSNERGVGFKVATPIISGDGASYKVYYGLVPA